MSITTAGVALFETHFYYIAICLFYSAQQRFCNEVELMWGFGGIAPSRRRHKGSGGRAPSARQFLRFFNKIYVILGIFEFKFMLQNMF